MLSPDKCSCQDNMKRKSRYHCWLCTADSWVRRSLQFKLFHIHQIYSRSWGVLKKPDAWRRGVGERNTSFQHKLYNPPHHLPLEFLNCSISFSKTYSSKKDSGSFLSYVCLKKKLTSLQRWCCQSPKYTIHTVKHHILCIWFYSKLGFIKFTALTLISHRLWNGRINSGSQELVCLVCSAFWQLIRAFQHML